MLRPRLLIIAVTSSALTAAALCFADESLPAYDGMHSERILFEPENNRFHKTISVPHGQRLTLQFQPEHASLRIQVFNHLGEDLFANRHADLLYRHRLSLTDSDCAPCAIEVTVVPRHQAPAALTLLSNVTDCQREPAFCDADTALELARRTEQSVSPTDISQRFALAIQQWQALPPSIEKLNAQFLALHAAESNAANSTAFTQLASQARQFKAWPALAQIQFMQLHAALAQDDTALTQQYLHELEQTLAAVQTTASHVFYTLSAQAELVRAELFLHTEQLEKHAAALVRASAMLDKIDDVAQVARVLNGIGFLHRINKHLDQAAASHQLALSFSTETTDLALQMQSAYYLGVVSALRGRYFYAQSLLARAEQEALALKAPIWQAHITAALARIAMELGSVQESEALYQQAQTLYRLSGASRELKTVYLNQARLFSLQGKPDTSEEFLRLAQRHLSDAPLDRRHYSETLAEAHLNAGQCAEAQHALTSLTDSGSVNGAPLLTAKIHLCLQNWRAAAASASAAVNQFTRDQDDLGMLSARFVLANARWKEGFASEALVIIAAATLSIESLRDDLQRDDLRRQFLALQRSLYDLQLQITRDESPSDILAALQVAERFKARTLFDALLRRNTPVRNTEVKVAQLPFADLMATTLARLQATPANAVPSGEQESRSLKDALSQLPEGTALLYFFLGSRQSYLWELSAGHQQVYSLPAEPELHDAIDAYLAQLNPQTGNRDALYQSGIRLSEHLLGSVAPQLDQYQNLVIVPDGALHRVPFAALFNPQSESRLLLTHNISYARSLSTFNYFSEHPSNPQAPTLSPEHILLVAPDLAGGELAAREAELAAITRAWPTTHPPRVLAGPAADLAGVTAALTQPFDIVHFASHTRLDWDYPSRSLIALNGDFASQPDSQLGIQTIRDASLAAELVVLSACATAAGKNLAGEGPMGLSRAFFEAGAKRVLATLWPVEDRATAQVMAQFYQNLLTEHDEPTSALRKAQLSLARNPRWNHPYYWAAFAFYGNPHAF
ncbi:CHAT domain-containing tetratricopeptide repeat protein [Teredinibacter turnerae]|uniref:CHAT domain-containing tetratricopeptide repeat protein n=1 Tax=Teredinibacter turnerae TaxID=2426 RepID=UPI00036B1D7B|nr:CHAT domain-containing protein [Teredinibacter turnerae]